jgi:hypothetical protein
LYLLRARWAAAYLACWPLFDGLCDTQLFVYVGEFRLDIRYTAASQHVVRIYTCPRLRSGVRQRVSGLGEGLYLCVYLCGNL